MYTYEIINKINTHKGVFPDESFAFKSTLVPICNNNFIIGSKPLEAARCNGVAPKRSAILTSAPFCNNNSQI